MTTRARHHRRALLLLGGFLALQVPSVPAGAQAGGARVEGVVWDSLRTLAPLGGATVMIPEHGLVARTDGKGRFRFDRVPAGRWTISFSHPRLDSLALFEVPASVTVPARGRVRVWLATPGAERLYGALCSDLTVAPAGVVVGRVHSVDNGTPMAGARVRARWRELALVDASLTEREGTRETTTGADGAFRLCDVPVDAALELQARTTTHSTGILRFEPAEAVVSVRDIGISLRDSATMLAVARNWLAPALAPGADTLAAGDSTATRDAAAADTILLPVALGAGSATITGTVTREGGAPLGGATVRVVGALGGARTGEDGRFTLVGVPAGTQTLDVRALGFSPESHILALATGARDSLAVGMTPVRALDRVTVYGSDVPRTGVRGSILEDVMRRSRYGVGRMVRGIDIADEFSIGDALQKRLLVRMAYGPHGRVPVIRFGMRQCVPSIAVDGIAQRSAEMFDLLVDPQEVFAIEVFPRLANVPSELLAAVQLSRGAEIDACGLIAIWRR